jgi:hypothetical protein
MVNSRRMHGFLQKRKRGHRADFKASQPGGGFAEDRYPNH